MIQTVLNTVTHFIQLFQLNLFPRTAHYPRKKKILIQQSLGLCFLSRLNVYLNKVPLV